MAASGHLRRSRSKSSSCATSGAAKTTIAFGDAIPKRSAVCIAISSTMVAGTRALVAAVATCIVLRLSQRHYHLIDGEMLSADELRLV